MISLRHNPILEADATELIDWPVYEGAFFGNVFNSTSYKVYACQGEPKDQAVLESPDRIWRICTDTGSPCNFTLLGKCSDVCQGYSKTFGYSNCTTGTGEVFTDVMNTFLRMNGVSVSSGEVPLPVGVFGFAITLVAALLISNIVS